MCDAAFALAKHLKDLAPACLREEGLSSIPLFWVVIKLACITAMASREDVADSVRTAFAAWNEMLNNELVAAPTKSALVFEICKACIYVTPA